MVRKRMKSSVRKKITRTILLFVIPLSMLLMFYNWYVLDMVNENAVRYASNSLDIYAHSLEDELQVTDDYFSYLIQRDMDFRKLVYANNEYKAVARMEEVNTKFQAVYYPVPSLAGHIILQSRWDQTKEYFNPVGSYSYLMKKELKEFFIESMAGEVVEQETDWRAFEADDRVYLIRMYEFKGTGVMVILDLNLTDVPQRKEDQVMDDFIYYTDSQKRPFVYEDYAQRAVRKGWLGIGFGENSWYLIAEEEIRETGIYMVYAVPYHEWAAINKIPLLFTLFSVAVIALLLICVRWIQRLYVMPLETLMCAMRKVKEGDINSRVDAEFQSEEFRLSASTFNDMLDQIESLKISWYEKELELQKTRVLYLEMQIRPHFILNCLKGIFSLAQEGRMEEIQETTVILSRYLRFVLRDDLILVSMREEMENVRNYMYLQQILADSITCEYLLEEGILSCRIPVLTVLTFVENAVKHGKQIGKKTVITIKARQIEEYLNITVLDNGKGFSEEDLDHLNHYREFCYGGREMGIQNVLQRLELMYHGKSEVVFLNANGACIEIFIPVDEEGVE